MVDVMNATYNLTGLTEAENILDIVIFSNTVTSGYLVGLFVLAFFFVSLFALKRWEFDKALTASSFISFMISIFFVYAGLVTFWLPLLFLIITSLMGLYLYMFKR